jgi:hypothetical protein
MELASIPSFGEIITLVVTAVLTYITKYIKDYLKARKDNEEDTLHVRKEENTIANAIDYVKDVFTKEKEKRPDLTKIDLALEYISIVEPEVFKRSGKDRLRLMIQRIVYQKSI